MSGKTTGKKSKSRVSFAGDDAPQTQLDLMKEELERMRRQDKETQRRELEHRQYELEKVKREQEAERLKKGLQLIPGSRLSKEDIQRKLGLEEKCLLKEDRTLIAAETAQMRNTMKIKHGTHVKKKSPSMMTLAKQYVQPHTKSGNVLGLPDRLLRELTLEEIVELKKMFDMYDISGAGFIRRKDVYKLISVLGFRITKTMFRTSIEKCVKDPSGHVTFVNFLDFIVEEQDGNDPFEEVAQCFRLLDTDEKGYLTFDDLRCASDDTDCQLSNRQIQEMLDEADTSGDAKINLEEFTIMMLRTSAFRF